MPLSRPEVLKLAARVESALHTFKPDLKGLAVLTEAATGPFLATPILAAAAGARRVVACTRDSRWGSAADVEAMTRTLANHFGVAERLEITTKPPTTVANDIDLVTNLGFVRPICREVVAKLSPHAVIALMWEPWEFRPEDIDVQACAEHGVPIIATNEHHPEVATFQAVGMLALKLLLEQACEVAGLTVAVVGSEPFGGACQALLTACGARAPLLDPTLGWPSDEALARLAESDAVVVVEHRTHAEILGPTTPHVVEALARRAAPLVHICGNVDAAYLMAHGLQKHPSHSVQPGFMTVTTSHVGVKPVVDLHTAGLHAAGLVCKARQRGKRTEEALALAVASGYGLRLAPRLRGTGTEAHA
ncbi:MAG: hypothetical protein VKS61_02865 [Candidatus Sericytochromatia bacterium]|nr:hypothetical protein [Candidatus Sericytochromatia bacterium]